MTDTELISKLQNIVDSYNTVYMWGTFGAPVTNTLIRLKTAQYPYWYTAARQNFFRSLIGKNYFAFDCVNVIKGLLWGWHGDATADFGGAIYQANNVPDISADTMINYCKAVSTDFRSIVPGEAVWLPGHIGIYIGNSKVIECTPSWTNGVQITALSNIRTVSGFNNRKWSRHGKLPYIKYATKNERKEEKKVEYLIFCGAGPDELAAGYLSSFLNAPIQVCRVDHDVIPPKIIVPAELLQGAKRHIIIGNQSKVSASCINIFGGNRYDTAQKVIDICTGKSRL